VKGRSSLAPDLDLSNLRVLVVDDEDDVRLGLRLLAESKEADAREAASAEAALEIIGSWIPHLVLSDINMTGISGVELLSRLRRQIPDTRVILITGFGTIELAVEAMRRGAVHFITKPFDNDEILGAIERYGREALIQEKIRNLERSGTASEPSIIAEDQRMKAVLDLVGQVAPTTMSVLIQGESGTGKELIARAVHTQSESKNSPFLAVNSAALPDTLLESELFGHKRGAFTGADRDREGIFAQARGGTVFLDEIALMSPAFQGKLLRVLQEKTAIPLGTATPTPVDFRLISATSCDLLKRIEKGEFREDLYYRLRVVTIDLPPLRERPGDIAPLAMHFLAKYAGQISSTPGQVPNLSAGALAALQRHTWKGNVRELENCIQRALVLAGGGEILTGHLALDDESGPWSGPPLELLSYEEGKQEALSSFQRRFIERALLRSEGNVTHAAEKCGISRAAFQRIMRSLDLDRNQFTT
jgi:DNA-binding NtrC family response regulator